jgi:hypothetical protein
VARQVLPLVGAVAGFAVGGPTGAQIGFALGSLVGNAVDPIEMQGRKLGDSPTQVAAEGGARAIVYGKGCIRATCILERGGRRVIRQRDRSGGKGGGPTTINERALWTFAIGLGEPVAAILRIWENEKLVYDVTPESTIPEDTAQFAEKFRFYTGAEDQLPDPALEALHGVGNTPYYRGTAYMVFPQYDLTDFGETVPTYRVEVVQEVEVVSPGTIMASGAVSLGEYRTSTSSNGEDWSAVHDPDFSTQALIALGNPRFLAYNDASAHYSDDYGASWVEADTSVFTGVALGYSDYRAGVLLILANTDGLYRSTDEGESFTRVNPPGFRITVAQFVADSQVYGLWSSDFYFLKSSNAGETWSVGGSHNLAGGDGLSHANHLGDAVFGGKHRFTDIPMVVITGDGETHTEYEFTTSTGSHISGLASNDNVSAPVLVAGTDAGELFYNDGSGWEQSAFTAPQGIQDIIWNGLIFLCGGGSSGDGFMAISEDGINWEPVTQPLEHLVYSIAAQPPISSVVGQQIPLSTVVAAVHDRCGHETSDYDVSELTELISGVVFESTITGAEAINSIIGAHFADPSDYDGKIHYIKRGNPVVLTLTEDDLIDEPDEAQRNNAIEYPKKVHFLGQRADLAYASSKSTSARYSDDAKVVGEITIGSPETYDDGTEPAEVAVKLHKVLWTEAEGEREWMIPDNYLELVPTDNVGLSYRGELVRCRILNIEDTPGQRKLRMIRDRQSAYTANLTEIPNPPSPTPPQSSVVAPTIMAFIDTSALTDNADTLHYLVALSGANDNWAGAVLQQQLTGEFQSIDSTTLNSIMGVLQNTVTDAAPWYTDTTNTVVVRLYTEDQLESRTDAEFLSNGGAFFLSWQDSGQTQWEIMQFRDAVQDSNGDWVLSHLMRGRKNTETAEHPPGATFVWIDPAILREPAQTSWINTTLTHRAVSNGQSPELAVPQDNEYVGNSQREWPVADLLLSRPTADSVLAETIPRHRFGTSMNPIRSINWDGYRWTATDGVNTINRDGTAEVETFDTTGWGSPVTVTVAQLNRLTGAGPTVSEDIV